ncbi:MAG TPA: 30S ribosomal protein S17 [Coxiellaceae bacterium]|nr:30S ribosomal protein S17 [Coxiellaceae bacterium]
MNENKKITRTLVGLVVGNKMNKSVTVSVERHVKHPKYGKFIKRFSKIHAHDEKNVCQIGDTVVIKECAPISKMKSWTLVDIKQRAEQQ